MNTPPPDDREKLLQRALNTISELTTELSRIEKTGNGDYSATFKALHAAREQYLKMTGIYPRLSPREENSG